MINYLKGKIVHKQENSTYGCSFTVEVNNIGYLVLTNKRILDELPCENTDVTTYTSLIHKEDAMLLCGFKAREDRDLFNILQGVSGIGLRVALLLLEQFNACELASVVIKEDDKALSKTKGVGPKLAKKIILELKDKLINWRDTTDLSTSAVNKISFDDEDLKQSYTEAETVLISLGYCKEEVDDGLEKALSKSINKQDSEDLLRIALQWISAGENSK